MSDAIVKKLANDDSWKKPDPKSAEGLPVTAAGASEVHKRRISSRMDRMEYEKQALVSLEAKALEAKGTIPVYHFHLGDLNFPTPPHIVEACKKALDEGKTGYCGPFGLPRLRELLAEKMGAARGVEYGADDVCVQPGGKPIIMKFLMTTVSPGDDVIYPIPGFPTYESVISFLQGNPRPYFYKETDTGGYQLDMEYLHGLLRRDYDQPDTGADGRYRNRKVLILNNHHNPLGACCSKDQLAQIAKWCNEYDVLCLSDEAYFDLVFNEDQKISIVSFPGMRDRTVILHTFSKFASMTGWRLGCALGPHYLIERISVISSNHDTCTTHFVQAAGVHAMESPLTEKFTKDMVEELRRRRDALVDGLRTIPGFKVHSPESTFYLFTNCTEAVKACGFQTIEEFRKAVLYETGVAFALRDFFGAKLSNPRALGAGKSYARFAFSSIGVDKIKEAMDKLRDFVKSGGRSTNGTPGAKRAKI